MFAVLTSLAMITVTLIGQSVKCKCCVTKIQRITNTMIYECVQDNLAISKKASKKSQCNNPMHQLGEIYYTISLITFVH